MRLEVIGTGSAGNCYALHSRAGSLLLDAGLRMAEIARTLGYRLNLDGCLITHEHGDHIRAAPELARRGVPCWMTRGTEGALPEGKRGRYRVFDALPAQVRIGGFIVRTFPTEHDAAEPCGYLILDTLTGEKLLYATDTYYLRFTFPGVNYWVIECNYVAERVEEMVAAGTMPLPVYARLMRSHMSLGRLLEAFAANDMRAARQIILVHLSDARSDQRRMVEAVERQTRTPCVAASAGTAVELALSPF